MNVITKFISRICGKFLNKSFFFLNSRRHSWISKWDFSATSQNHFWKRCLVRVVITHKAQNWWLCLASILWVMTPHDLPPVSVYKYVKK